MQDITLVERSLRIITSKRHDSRPGNVVLFATIYCHIAIMWFVCVCENNLTTAHLSDLPLRTMIGSNKNCFFEL